VKLTKTQLKQMIQEAAPEYVWGVKGPQRAANKYKISVLKKIIMEELSEVYSEKQRRWACAQTGDDFEGDPSLSKKEAEEMCKGPMKEELEEQAGPATDNEQAFSRISEIGQQMLYLQEEAMNILRHLDIDEDYRNTAAAALAGLYNPIKGAFNKIIDIKRTS
jgi:hypothetical protein